MPLSQPRAAGPKQKICIEYFLKAHRFVNAHHLRIRVLNVHTESPWENFSKVRDCRSEEYKFCMRDHSCFEIKVYPRLDLNIPRTQLKWSYISNGCLQGCLFVHKLVVYLLSADLLIKILMRKNLISCRKSDFIPNGVIFTPIGVKFDFILINKSAESERFY